MKKMRKLAALCAVLALMFCFTTVAYASGGEKIPGAAGTSAPATTKATTPERPKEPNPFTPAGTGTVIDNATDTDGKEFYTIMAPDKTVFYLVIDRQRKQENVYFLNAVTGKDLLALAEKSGDAVNSESTTSKPKPESTPKTTSAPEASAKPSSTPEQKNNTGMLLIVLAVVVIGGGAGYYFKVYRPKQQQAENEDDFDYENETDLYDAEDTERDDDLPPWEDDKDGDGEA